MPAYENQPRPNDIVYEHRVKIKECSGDHTGPCFTVLSNQSLSAHRIRKHYLDSGTTIKVVKVVKLKYKDTYEAKQLKRMKGRK